MSIRIKPFAWYRTLCLWSLRLSQYSQRGSRISLPPSHTEGPEKATKPNSLLVNVHCSGGRDVRSRGPVKSMGGALTRRVHPPTAHTPIPPNQKIDAFNN